MLFLNSESKLAYAAQPGGEPTVLFLSGLRSHMRGTKASYLAEHCARRGRGYLRFDYRGHGASQGRFEDGTIGDWLEDTLTVLDALVEDRAILVGSSMGGWLAFLAALARPRKVAGIVGIAAAPDFTSELIEPRLSPAQREALARDGLCLEPSEYGDPLPITARLIEDGRRHRLMDRAIPLDCPVHLLHGRLDPDVPWQTAMTLAGKLRSRAVTVEPIEDGDHRLSREQDLTRLAAAVDRVAAQVEERV